MVYNSQQDYLFPISGLVSRENEKAGKKIQGTAKNKEIGDGQTWDVRILADKAII